MASRSAFNWNINLYRLSCSAFVRLSWKAQLMTSKQKKEVTCAAGFTQPSPPILYISHTILRDTFAYFLPYDRAGVETACYWFGIEANTSQVVTTIVIPRLYQTKGNYRIDTTSSRSRAHEM